MLKIIQKVMWRVDIPTTPRLTLGWPPRSESILIYFGTERFDHARRDINTESEQELMDCINYCLSDVETKRA